MTLRYIVGVDEAGCGALVGSLVVAAVAFPVTTERVSVSWHGVSGTKTLVAGDSKGIKDPAHRAHLAQAVQAASAALMVIEKTAREIDARLLGTVLPEALALAAARCLERLSTLDPTLRPENFLVLIDGGGVVPHLPCPVKCIPDGDKSEWHIGAASIVAKATHDLHVATLHQTYPDWGFDKSRGYPTRAHKTFLSQRGPTPAHRKSYQPVRDALPRALGIEV